MLLQTNSKLWKYLCGITTGRLKDNKKSSLIAEIPATVAISIRGRGHEYRRLQESSSDYKIVISATLQVLTQSCTDAPAECRFAPSRPPWVRFPFGSCGLIKDANHLVKSRLKCERDKTHDKASPRDLTAVGGEGGAFHPARRTLSPFYSLNNCLFPE